MEHVRGTILLLNKLICITLLLVAMREQIKHPSLKIIDNITSNGELHNYNTRNVNCAHILYRRTQIS